LATGLTTIKDKCPTGRLKRWSVLGGQKYECLQSPLIPRTSRLEVCFCAIRACFQQWITREQGCSKRGKTERWCWADCFNTKQPSAHSVFSHIRAFFAYALCTNILLPVLCYSLKLLKI